MDSAQKIYTLVGVLERDGVAALAVKVREQSRLGWTPCGEILHTSKEDHDEGYAPAMSQMLWKVARARR